MNILKHGVFPAALYFLLFCLLTYPLILDFSLRFFTDDGDGFMNVWNLWWVNTAVTQPSLHPSIWHTDLLHWPFGTTLLGQTLNPFNGLISVPLLRFMSLVQAHNLIVLFAFVMSGATAYWLAYHLTKSFLGSIVAGFIFTFSSYHFAHYYGHLNLISLEWIPLFVLCWYILITRPSALMALTSALTLWLILLCDYYYFFYCVLTGVLIVLWYGFTRKDFLFFIKREYLVSLSTFALLTLILTGPVVFPLLRLTRIDPFMDAHKPESFSLDLFAPFIPGETWRFNQLTEAYWSKLPLEMSETSVYLGYSVIILFVIIWIKRRDVDADEGRMVQLWSLIMGFFFLMALGPVLQINGKIVFDTLMPYTIMEKVIPFLQLSGVPVRMMVMVTLSMSVMSAMAITHLSKTPRGKIFTLLLVTLLFIEYLPRSLPSTSTGTPKFVTALAELPNDGGVLDMAAPTKYIQLYYQTQYNKPMAFGYIARTSSSVVEKEKALNRAINRENYAALWDTYHIRYIVTNDGITYDDPYVMV
jgi:hypothetical protein